MPCRRQRSPRIEPRKMSDALRFMKDEKREDLRRAVADNATTLGLGQKAAQTAKDSIKGARETVDWQTGEVTCLTRDFLHEMLTAEGYTDSSHASTANHLWETTHYTRNLYVFDGTEATKADLFSSWVKAGNTREQCETRFLELNLKRSTELKVVNPQWEVKEKERIVAKYKKRRADHTPSAPA